MSQKQQTLCEQIETSMLSCFASSPLPLPQWFHHGTDCRLTRKSVMQNFPNYIRLEEKQMFNILEELKELKFKKKEYSSLQTYQLLMKQFPFPSFSLLKKVTGRQLDIVKCTKSLKSQGVILKDVVLMFDEMYLQKCEEYSVGEIIGANENNDLCNGLLLFMIVLLLYYCFQSDPLETRFGHYRQMNGSHFVVGLKDTVCSEKF